MIGSLAGAAVIAALFAPSGVSAVPPSCSSTTAFTPKNTPITVNLNCSDLPANPIVTVAQAPTNGTVPAAWPLVYTPNPEHHGFDRFEIKLSNGAETSGTIAVTVFANTRPSCTDAGAVTTFVNQPVTIKTADFPCADPDDTQRIIHPSDGAHGTAELDVANDGVKYTPEAGFVGADTFQFHVSDGIQDSGTSEFTVNVVNPPVATPTATPSPSVTPAPTPAPTLAGPAADKTAPTVTAKAGKASIAKGIALTLTSNEAGTAQLTLTTGKNKTTKSVKLAKGATKLTLKLSAKARKALKRKKSVKARLTVVATDAAGNRTTRTLSVTLKR
jgi:hypothetical protein